MSYPERLCLPLVSSELILLVNLIRHYLPKRALFPFLPQWRPLANLHATRFCARRPRASHSWRIHWESESAKVGVRFFPSPQASNRALGSACVLHFVLLLLDWLAALVAHAEAENFHHHALLMADTILKRAETRRWQRYGPSKLILYLSVQWINGIEAAQLDHYF